MIVVFLFKKWKKKTLGHPKFWILSYSKHSLRWFVILNLENATYWKMQSHQYDRVSIWLANTDSPYIHLLLLTVKPLQYFKLIGIVKSCQKGVNNSKKLFQVCFDTQIYFRYCNGFNINDNKDVRTVFNIWLTFTHNIDRYEFFCSMEF